MIDSEETVKLVDGGYKNINEKFTQSARQLVSAGKVYLKALHGEVSASKAYADALRKLASHAHQGIWGGCADIGTALMQLADVQQQMEAEQLKILKSLYVDLLVPLELNIDRDSKVIASEQKRFIQQHKCAQESFVRVASTVRKQRKKSKANRGVNIEKEVKNLQALEEEKMKLDCFCEESLKQVIMQERRRFGFILERQCFIAKHRLNYYSKGKELLHRLSEWEGVAECRESLPKPIDKMFSNNGISGYRELESGITTSADRCLRVAGRGICDMILRKTKSVDTSCTGNGEFLSRPPHRNITRAKSDFNIASSSINPTSDDCAMCNISAIRPKSVASSDPGCFLNRVRAIYSYSANGDNQLNFNEGDFITLIGARNKDWQYGENERSLKCGWFPITYTEPVSEEIQTDDSFVKSFSDSLDSSVDGIKESFLKTPVTLGKTSTVAHGCEFDSAYTASPVSASLSLEAIPTVQSHFTAFTNHGTIVDLQRFDSQPLHSSSHLSAGSPTSSTAASSDDVLLTNESAKDSAQPVPPWPSLRRSSNIFKGNSSWRSAKRERQSSSAPSLE